MRGAPGEGKMVEAVAPEGEGLPLPVFANDMMISTSKESGVCVLTYSFKLKKDSAPQVVARVALPEVMMDNLRATMAREHLARAAGQG